MTARWARCTRTRPREALSRVESMITMGGFALPPRNIREMMVSSVDVIVQAARLRDGSRRITHITEVMGMEGDIIITQDIVRLRHGRRGRERQDDGTACLDRDRPAALLGARPLLSANRRGLPRRSMRSSQKAQTA